VLAETGFEQYEKGVAQLLKEQPDPNGRCASLSLTA